MKTKLAIGSILFIVAGLGPACAAVVQHDLELIADPQKKSVVVTDRVVFPTAPADKVSFQLAADARIVFTDIPIASESKQGEWFRSYTLHWPPDRSDWVLQIQLPWPGPDPDYLWLDSSRDWYPNFADVLARQYPLLQFSLRAELPSAWDAISQGELQDKKTTAGQRTRWHFVAHHPQQSVEFVAAPFQVYRQPGAVPAAAYLLRPDPELADKYLQATTQYIHLYDKMLGPYPYHRFALVENPEQTGYGMPSFTLLGSQVIRLPFILHSSYPHEILHNWWGNSVYVGAGGNWSEGLTAYLADHFLKEQQGQGTAYRRDALQSYRDYVSAEKDFALTAFRARHDRASQAVGYNKALLLFHMLRGRLGEAKFFAALQNFYRDKKFQLASFDDLRVQFEKAGNVDLHTFFKQWVEWVGAPELRLGAVQWGDDKTDALQFELQQVQNGPAYELTVPLLLSDADGARLRKEKLTMGKKSQTYKVPVPTAARSLTIDPDFDLFRLLDSSEVPPSIGALLGKEQWVFVLPRQATSEQLLVYREFAAQWGAAVTVKWDDEALPEDRPLWLLGWENLLLPRFSATLPPQAASFPANGVRLAEREFDRHHSVVLAGRVGGTPWLWSAQVSVEDTPARRLRHYGKYSYVVFAHSRPVVRGQWPVNDSVLSRSLPGKQ